MRKTPLLQHREEQLAVANTLAIVKQAGCFYLHTTMPWVPVWHNSIWHSPHSFSAFAWQINRYRCVANTRHVNLREGITLTQSTNTETLLFIPVVAVVRITPVIEQLPGGKFENPQYMEFALVSTAVIGNRVVAYTDSSDVTSYDGAQ